MKGRGKTVKVFWMLQSTDTRDYIYITGNLHFNVTSAKYSPEVVRKIEPFLYEFVSKHRGSISAEHGLHGLEQE